MTQETIKQLEAEMSQAKSKYGNYNSTHEIYAVLQEEVDEFWDLVKMKGDTEGRGIKMIVELRQCAAVSLRAAQELENGEVKWV